MRPLKATLLEKPSLLIPALFLSLLLLDFPHAQSMPDVPVGCSDGSMRCGLVFETPAEMAAIPQDESNFIHHRGLPSRVDLSGDFPPVGRQGNQGSCVAWATTYEVKSYLEKKTRGWSYNAGPENARCGTGATHVFSPAWTYNQINGGQDGGSSISTAFSLMIQKGAAPCDLMPYNDRDYRTQPTPATMLAAGSFRSARMTTLDCHNIDAMKAVLATGVPVVGGFKVTAALRSVGEGVIDSFDNNVTGGHGMAIVGYDDSIRSPRGQTGAFRLMNSWGTSWGHQGFGWISYDVMPQFCKYSFAMYLQTQIQPPSPDQPISPPAAVRASQGNYPDRIVVSWNDVAGSTAWLVQRQAAGEESFQDLGFSQTTQYEDRSVRPGAAYRYRVVTIVNNRRSEAADSPVAEGFTKSQGMVVPGPVQGLRASLSSDGSVSLSWSASDSAQSYRIYRRNVSTQVFNSSSTSYTDRPPSGTVSYSVRGVNAAGEGEDGETVLVQVPGAGGPPGRVAGFEASRATHRDHVVLSWQLVPDAELYYLIRFDYQRRVWDRLGFVKTDSYDDSDEKVKSGAYFAYRILAANSAGYSEWSDVQYGRTDPSLERAGARSAPPQNFHGELSSTGSLRLTWNGVPGATEYNVFMKKADDHEFQFLSRTTQLTFTASVPARKTLFYFTVRAKSALGIESEDAHIVPAFINEAPPLSSERLSDSGLEDFLGTWNGVDLQGITLHRYRIEILRTSGGFSARILDNGRLLGNASGVYATGATTLVDGGFRMTLRPNSRLAEVRISDRRFLADEVRFTVEGRR